MVIVKFHFNKNPKTFTCKYVHHNGQIFVKRHGSIKKRLYEDLMI